MSQVDVPLYEKTESESKYQVYLIKAKEFFMSSFGRYLLLFIVLVVALRLLNPEMVQQARTHDVEIAPPDYNRILMWASFVTAVAFAVPFCIDWYNQS